MMNRGRMPGRYDDLYPDDGYDRYYPGGYHGHGGSLMDMMMRQTQLLRAIDRTTKQINRTTMDTNRIVREMYDEEPGSGPRM